MVIQTLGREHAEALIQLRRQAIEECPQYFSSTVEEVTTGLEPIEERLHSEDNVYLGAFEEERLVGMVRFERAEYTKLRHQAIVGSMFIIPAMRRRGVGRALMLELIAIARHLKIEQLCLEVGSNNQNARQLYESLGFSLYGKAPRAIKIQDRYYDEDLMVYVFSRG